MEQSNIRTVRFIGEQNAEDLYRCEENGRVFVRQRCDDKCVRWLTSIKWQGGYEADCCLKEGLILKIVDKEKRVLHEEIVVKAEGYCDTVAYKVAPFSDEALDQIAEGVAVRANLKSYVEWKTQLMRSAREHKFTGYSDNWCYAEVEYGKVKTLFQFDYLGVPACCTTQEATHKISGQKWTCVELRDKKKEIVLEICGYIMEEAV